MKQLPRQVKVCGVWYTISISRNPPKTPGSPDGASGTVDFNKSSIKIWGAKDNQQKWKTLWHEVYHAFWWEARGMSHEYNDEHDEYMASSFATMMMGLEYKY